MYLSQEEREKEEEEEKPDMRLDQTHNIRWFWVSLYRDITPREILMTWHAANLVKYVPELTHNSVHVRPDSEHPSILHISGRYSTWIDEALGYKRDDIIHLSIIFDVSRRRVLALPTIRSTKYNAQCNDYHENKTYPLLTETTRIERKMDGRLAVVYERVPGEWRVASAHTSDGLDVLPGGNVLRDHFWQVFDAQQMQRSWFESGYTYMFELCSPDSAVFIRHTDARCYYLGRRALSNINKSDTPFETFRPPLVRCWRPYQETLLTLQAEADALDGTKHEGLVLVAGEEHRLLFTNSQFTRLAAKYPLNKRDTAVSFDVLWKAAQDGELDELVHYWPINGLAATHLDAALTEEAEKINFLFVSVQEKTNTELAQDPTLSKLRKKILFFMRNRNINARDAILRLPHTKITLIYNHSFSLLCANKGKYL